MQFVGFLEDELWTEGAAANFCPIKQCDDDDDAEEDGACTCSSVPIDKATIDPPELIGDAWCPIDGDDLDPAVIWGDGRP